MRLGGNKWVMSFTLAKFKIMHVEPHNEYFMRGTKLSTIEEEKDIGVIVTRNQKPSICTVQQGSRKSDNGSL
jgi:hypothetical protein